MDAVMTKFERVVEQARTTYRTNFRRMAASGERFTLAVLPVSPERDRVGLLCEPQGAIDASTYPGAVIAVRDVHAKTEAQTIAQFRDWLRTFPLYM